MTAWKNLLKLLKAVDLLSRPQGATKDELAAALDVSRRQVDRIVNRLEDMRFPLYEDTERDGRTKRWKLDADYCLKLPNISVPELRLTPKEIMALYLLRCQGHLAEDTDFETCLNSAFSKLNLFLPDEVLKTLQHLDSVFIPHGKFSKDYSGKEKIIDTLTDAMLDRHSCHITYHSFHDDKVKNFRIDPLHFFERNGGLYLLIRATDYGSIRILAVERIREVRADKNARFDYPADFKVENYLDSAFNLIHDDPLDLRIRFSPEVARYIRERQWSPDQQLTDESDGSVVLAMHTSGRLEIKMWILSYGPHAEVLQPADLRDEIATDLGTAARLYQESTSDFTPRY